MLPEQARELWLPQALLEIRACLMSALCTKVTMQAGCQRNDLRSVALDSNRVRMLTRVAGLFLRRMSR